MAICEAYMTQLPKPKEDEAFDIWSSMQESKVTLPPPYVHPLVRRSSSSLSQRSLEICTESLGSETGSDGFSDTDNCFSFQSSSEEEEETLETLVQRNDELVGINYHCSIGRKSTPQSFPPPLPSICRRDGPCLQMRTHRIGGRLVVEALAAPSKNYLHCKRQGGRLLLSFIETSFEKLYPDVIQQPKSQSLSEFHSKLEPELYEEEEEEEEEEVEVVDRGIVVEVKVSRQPQLQRRGVKLHKSSLVINKFVSGTPIFDHHYHQTTTTTNSGQAIEVDGWGSGRRNHVGGGAQQQAQDTKLLFTSKKLMNRQALLHQVRKCSYHHKPLFIWEPCCIATS